MHQKPCFYPGEFSPPTKYHMNTVKWLLTQPEVSNVGVVVGKDGANGLSQDQIVKLWEILLKSSFSPSVTIIKAKDGGPLTEIKSIFKKSGGSRSVIALDEETAKNKDLQKSFEDYPDYEMIIIPSQYHNSSKKALQAAQSGDMTSLRSELPDSFSDDVLNNYKDIINPPQQDPEAPEEVSPQIGVKEKYTKAFDDGFWKSIFSPMVKEEGNKKFPKDKDDPFGGEFIYNKQVGNHKYNGLDQKVIDAIASYITKAMVFRKPDVDSEKYKQDIDKIYQKLVSKNPELGSIKTEVPGYRDAFFPKHDIVFGAISGIPPEAIKDFVEDTKGYGGVANDELGLDLKYERGQEYIKLKK